MYRNAMVLLAALSLCTAVGAQTTGSALEAQAAALRAAGKIHEAGDAYNKAGRTYTAEGNSRAAVRAYGAASNLYEKEADLLLKGLEAPKGQVAVTAPRVVPKPIALPPLAPRAGMIVGRLVNELGGAVTNVSVVYSGFEDGKVIINHFENVSGTVKSSGGSYAIKVPPGAYRVSAYVTYLYRGHTYNFELEAINPPTRHDYEGLGLDKLRGGLVRDFVLKMTSKRANASEETESVYMHAYYGGVMTFDCTQVERILGGGHTFLPPLTGMGAQSAYPPDSRLQVILTPQGPLVDGSVGRAVQINLRLGDNGRYPFSQRGIFPGTYTATASLTTPTGETVPLRLSLAGARTVLNGSPDGYDMLVMDWKPSVTVEFLPNDLGPMPRYGVKAVRLFPGK